MITVTINEDTLLKILLDRVRYWITYTAVIDLYKDYYKRLIDAGWFEDRKLDINNIVDNDCINMLVVVSKEDFKQWNIKDETDEKVVACDKEQDLYLIRTYS